MNTVTKLTAITLLLAITSQSAAMNPALGIKTPYTVAQQTLTRTQQYRTLATRTVAPFFSIEHKEAQKKYYAKLKALPWGTVAEYYIEKQLKPAEKELRKEFTELLYCTPKEWQTVLKDTHRLIKKANAHFRLYERRF
ncbi:MAG: hypothetical protein NT124_03835 [Candidatus Dependentiae bacterium]|nr:hypothetical protein [Candidatus Dependentiae bacterium]